jgi:hypothetical protein
VVNTAGLGGRKLTKNFKVYTDDPDKPQTDLAVTGQIGNYVDITPPRVNFYGIQGDPLVQEVRITPVKGYPFTITEARARTGRDIRVDFKPLGKKPSQSGYLLIITSLKKQPGNFGDFIEIKTDLKEKPTLRIPVSGRILPPKG